VPGVHKLCVGPQLSGLASLGGDDVKLAVGLKQHITPGFAEYNPFAIGGVFREVVAHAVVGSTFNWLWLAAFSIVKWEPVQAEQEGLSIFGEFPAFFAGQKHLAHALSVLEVVGLSSGKDNIFAVGTPGRIALDVLGVVCSRQCLEGLRLPVIYAQDAFDGEK